MLSCPNPWAVAVPVSPSTPGMDCRGTGGGLRAGAGNVSMLEAKLIFLVQFPHSCTHSSQHHTPNISWSPPRGRKPWVVLAGPGAPTLQAPAGREVGKHQREPRKGGSWHTQGNQIPIQTQQHFIHMLSSVLPSRGCVNKP